jgi:hypothetical protein
MIRYLSSNKDICAFVGIACVIFIVVPSVGQEWRMAPEPAVRPVSSRIQDDDEKPRMPASARAISVATSEFQKAVNGKASVRNRCQVQGKENEIDENSEIFETDRCKLVVKTVKTTHPDVSPNASSTTRQQSVEFTVYADLSELTTPVLVEPQKFAQCDAGAGVLRVSSRSEPKQSMQVIRRSQDKPGEGEKQTRKDLSLFFGDPKAAKKAADALDRAIKACGGKEWPDEDDLP